MSAMSERAAVIDQLIADLPAEDLKALAERLASHVGYVLTAEPAHPDGPAQGPGPGPAVADGWVIVPREITLEMQHAYFKVVDRNMRRVETDCAFGRYDSQKQAYRAMIAATPTRETDHGRP